MPTFAERIKANPAVESVDDALASGDTFFVNLRPGYAFAFEAHSAGFDTIREAYLAVRQIRSCSCERCEELK